MNKRGSYIAVTLFVIGLFLCLAAEKALASFIIDSNTVYDLSCSPVPVFSRSYDAGKTYTDLMALSTDTAEAFCPEILKNKDALEAFWAASNKQYISRSIDNGATWSQPLSIMDYEKQPYFANISKNPQNGNTLIVWQDKQKNIFAAFSESGTSFLARVQINDLSPAAGKPTVSSSNNYVLIVWQDTNSNNLKSVESVNFGRTFSGIKELGATLLPQTSPRSCVFGNNAICSWIESSPGSNKLRYRIKNTAASLWSNPAEIFSSTSPITGSDILATLQGACFAAWTSNDTLFYSRSLSASSKWLVPKKVLVPSAEAESVTIASSQGLLLALCAGKIYSLDLESLPRPSSKVPDSFIFNSSLPVITFEAEGMPDFGSYLFNIESGNDPSLKSASVFAATSDEFKFPSSLSDGTYYYRISCGNGISSITSGIKSFAIDTSPKAAFRIIKPDSSSWFKAGASIAVEADLNDNMIAIEDETEASASLNGKDITASLTYDKNEKKIFGIINIPDTGILSGPNDLEIRITAASLSVAKAWCKINIDLNEPSVLFSVPENAVYSGSGDKIKVQVIDTLSGPDNKNSSARMFSGVSTIEGSCQPGDTAAEIAFIPRVALPDGIYTMDITPKDLAGNTGKKVQINVIVDSVRPVITLLQELPQTSEKSSLAVSGKVDKPGIKKLTFTMNSKSLKDVPLTDGNFSTGVALEKGLNLLTILAQDKAGNTASINKSITCTAVSTGAIFEFDGKRICDNDFVSETPSVKITDSSGAAFAASGAILDSSSVPYDALTGDVTIGTLLPGKHELLLDTTSSTYKIDFTVEKNVSISSLLACPNPYNPALGNAKITYNLSIPSPVKLYIFDLTGRLVSKQEASGTTGYNDNLEWNGTLASGEPAGNGTYLIKIIASGSTGGSSFAKSKLILLR